MGEGIEVYGNYYTQTTAKRTCTNSTHSLETPSTFTSHAVAEREGGCVDVGTGLTGVLDQALALTINGLVLAHEAAQGR